MPRVHNRIRQLNRPRSRWASDTLNLVATTTGAAETVTFDRITPSVDTTIYWGDGSQETITAGDTGTQTHTYATAGSYNVRVARASRLTGLRLSNSKISGLDTAELRYSPITYFMVNNLGTVSENQVVSADMQGWTPNNWYLYAMPAGTYDIQSIHMSGWDPSTWYLYSMPAGTYDIQSTHMSGWDSNYWRLSSMPAGTYDIQSIHMSGWTPIYWRLSSMPAGTYDIQSTHMSGWDPIYWYLFFMPSGNYTIDGADFTGWVSTTVFYCLSLIDSVDGDLSTADVDGILWGLYQASRDGPRTATGGTINVGGTSADPSGTFQAAASCPVTAATPGKEIAWELLNDPTGCNAGFNVWDTVAY